MNSFKSAYFLAAALTTGILTVLLPSSCGPVKACSSTTCTGCCDADGTCQNGSTNTACGSSGTLCKACSTFDVCQLGFCAPFGGGGSGGTGGSGGGSTGGGTGGGSTGNCAATCAGCCTPGGTCINPATTTAACGTGGALCQSCSASQSCTAGQCRSATCTGCVDSSSTCLAGTSNTACGNGGISCVACTGSDTCNASGFCTGGACGGCRDTNSVCQVGNTRGACGSGGNSCAVCPTGYACTLGACVPGTGGGSGGGSTGGGTGGGFGGGFGGGGSTGGGSGGGGGTNAGESCTNAEPLVFTGGQAQASGTLVGYLNNYNPSCALSGSPDHVYSFTVTGTQVLNVAIESGTNLVGAMAVYGSGCTSERACMSGSINNLTLTSGTYYLVVDVASGSADSYFLSASLSTTPPPTDAGSFTSTPLSNGVSVVVPAGVMGSWTYYSVNVVSSAQLHVTTIADAGMGDADLYMSYATQPTTGSTYSSTQSPPVGEDIAVPSPTPGTWYIGVYGYSAHSGQVLRATW